MRQESASVEINNAAENMLFVFMIQSPLFVSVSDKIFRARFIESMISTAQ